MEKTTHPDRPPAPAHTGPPQDEGVRRLKISLDPKGGNGHGWLSPYLEVCWLPLIGPSAVVMVRRLAAGLQHHNPLDVDAADLAQDLGLRRSTSRHAPVSRTLDRLTYFGILHKTGTDQWAMPATAPDVPERLALRLRPGLAVTERTIRQNARRPIAPPGPGR